MGPNAVPRLLRLLGEPSPDLRDRLWAILRRYHRTKVPLPPNQLHNLHAFYAFCALGPQGSNAVPVLISMLERDPSLFCQQSVPKILGIIGPTAEMAVPVLVERTTNANDYVRENSIIGLGQIHGQPALAVPTLIQALNDPFISARIEAARSLGAYGKDAHPAIPPLLELRRREMLNAAQQPSVVTLPGGGYDPRAGPKGTTPMTVRRGLSGPVWPEDAIAAVSNTLLQIDIPATIKADLR